MITAIYMATVIRWIDPSGTTRIGLPLLAATYLGLLGGDIKEIVWSAILTTGLYSAFIYFVLTTPVILGYLTPAFYYVVFYFVVPTIPFVLIAALIGGILGGVIRNLL